jgi:hypothetical protein
MQDWGEIEKKLPILITQFEKRALAFKIKKLSIVIICLPLSMCVVIIVLNSVQITLQYSS